MYFFRILFVTLVCLFIADSTYAQTTHYDNSLNYSGSRMAHDSLEPLSAAIDAMMPEAVTTPFKVYSVVEYSLVKNQQADTRETLKARILQDVDVQSPYKLVLWWTGGAGSQFKNVEISFSYPNDNDFFNCFTDAKIELIKAKLQQYANGLIAANQPEANTYINLELKVLKKAEGLVYKISSCCANKNKSEECSLCVSGEDLALMKYNMGIRDLPTAEPLNPTINYNTNNYDSITGYFHDYVGQDLVFGGESISLLDEYRNFADDSGSSPPHHVYFVNDNYFCDNTIPENTEGGHSVISVTLTSEGYKLEVKHHKVGENLTFAESFIDNSSEYFGFVLARLPVLLDNLFRVDENSDEECFYTGVGGVICRKNSENNSSFLLNDVVLVNALPGVTNGMLYSFKCGGIEYEVFKNAISNEYIDYFPKEEVELLIESSNSVVTSLMLGEEINGFSEINEGYVAQKGKVVKMLAIHISEGISKRSYWMDVVSFEGVSGKGLELSVPIPDLSEIVSGNDAWILTVYSPEISRSLRRAIAQNDLLEQRRLTYFALNNNFPDSWAALLSNNVGLLRHNKAASLIKYPENDQYRGLTVRLCNFVTEEDCVTSNPDLVDRIEVTEKYFFRGYGHSGWQVDELYPVDLKLYNNENSFCNGDLYYENYDFQGYFFESSFFGFGKGTLTGRIRGYGYLEYIYEVRGISNIPSASWGISLGKYIGPVEFPGDFPSGATVATFVGEGKVASGMGIGAWVSVDEFGLNTWYGETIEGPGIPTRQDLMITGPRNLHGGVNELLTGSFLITETSILTNFNRQLFTAQVLNSCYVDY